MSGVNSKLRVGVIRTRTIEAGQLTVRHVTLPRGRGGVSAGSLQKLRREVRRLRHRLRHLEHEVRELGSELRQDKAELEGQILALSQALAALQAEIASGMPANAALQSLFVSKTGQVVTVTTAAETVVGTVTQVAVNAVELVQANGDIVIIPFSKITSVQ